MKNRYQLVLPYHSSQVHVSSSLKGGSSKCYKELKNSSYVRDAKEFSVLDLDNYKIYNYAISHKMIGGGEEVKEQEPAPAPAPVPEPDQPNCSNSSVMNKLNVIENKLDTLLNECKTTSSRMNNMATNTRIYEENMEKLKMYKMLEREKQEDSCSIM